MTRGHRPVLRFEDRMNHPPDSVSRCRELIAVAVSQIDGDPIVGDRLVNAALEITVAHFKKIIALQRAGRRNPMTHENAEDLTANILVGTSIRHRSRIGFARHCSYGRTATVDKIAQLMGQLAFCRGSGCRSRRKEDYSPNWDQQRFQLFRLGDSHIDLGQRLLSRKTRLSMLQENLFLKTWEERM